MKVIVTGGAGLLGSELCKAHLYAGDEVLCIDNFVSSDSEKLHESKKFDKFRIMEHDICTHMDFHADMVYNMACIASPAIYGKYPIDTLKTCTQGVMNVLEMAKRTGAKVLQASTSEVYGNPLEHPQKESYNGNVGMHGFRSCYDEGKRVAEAMCAAYYNYGVDVKIARIFNTYGPWMNIHDGRVVSNFIVSALRNEVLEVHGGGEQTRSLCYIDDTIIGLIKLMVHESDVLQVLNIGNPEEIKIKDLAEMIIDLTDSESDVSGDAEILNDEPLVRCPDITKANDVLGWKPEVSLKDGLDRTIMMFKRRLRAR